MVRKAYRDSLNLGSEESNGYSLGIIILCRFLGSWIT